MIQIFTKKGRPGRTRWDARVEAGRSDWDERSRPDELRGGDGRAPPTASRTTPASQGNALGDLCLVPARCRTAGRSARARPSKFVLSASGGADRYTFFVSAARTSEEGVYLNNYSNLTSARGELHARPDEHAELHDERRAQPHASPPAAERQRRAARPDRQLVPRGAGEAVPDVRAAELLDRSTRNRPRTYDNQTRADRYTVGASATYAPFAWFRNTVRVGLDANVGRADCTFRQPCRPRTSRAGASVSTMRRVSSRRGGRSRTMSR